MKLWTKSLIYIVLSLMCIFTTIGYAVISDELMVNGTASISPQLPDVYISNVTPTDSAGVHVTATSGTLLTTSVTGNGTATFTVYVKNISNKVYVYDRTLDGAEAGIEGVYNGTDITYKVSGINMLDELAPNTVRSFTVEITVPKGVTAEQYVLNFRFIEKTGTEILPGDNHFNITFKYNNGEPDTVTQIHAGDFVPRPQSPTKPGYSFIGWYTDTTYTTAWNFEVDRPTDDITLYAGWESIPLPDPTPSDYLVTYKPGNGEADSYVIAEANSLLAVPTVPEWENEDFIFVGWYTDSAWTNPWNFDTDRVTGNMTLYGGWEENIPPVPPDIYITFRPNNGEADTVVKYLTGDFITRPTAPIKPGYTFIGWYTDETYTKAWNFEVERVYSDMILYAGWTEAPIIETVEYRVTFELNNGNPSSTVTVEEGNLIPRPDVPTKEGYTFIGWYRDANCTVAWNFDTDKPTADMTLYAGWEITNDDGEMSSSDFFGLVEVLLDPDVNNSLNNSNQIYSKVNGIVVPNKYKDHAPVFHCEVPSISGGTMSKLTQAANANLTSELRFVFMKDPSSSNRLFLYMYYKKDCIDSNEGKEIVTYFQVISRDSSNGEWYADGSYEGTAVVGEFVGGYNNGKPILMIDAYSWKSAARTVAE